MPAPIVIVTYFNVFGTGGMETHVQRLAVALTRLGHRGEILTPADPAVGDAVPRRLGAFDVTAVGPPTDKWIPWWRAAELPVLVVRYWTRTLRMLLHTLAALDRTTARILYVPGPVNLPSTATLNLALTWRFLRFGRRVRLVLGARGAGSHWYERPVIARLFALEERAQIGAADAVVVVDHYYADVLFPGKFRSKYIVIPNGVDTSVFKPEGGRRDGFVTFVGRLTRDRGIDVFLDALEFLRDTPGAFRVVGDGPLREWFTKEVEHRRLNVEWMGSVPHAEMPKVYNEARLVVNPAPVEGIGNTTLEAMACGRCVVRAGSRYAEFAIRDGVNGMLFETGNPRSLAARIQEALDNPDLVERLGHAARETVLREFTMEGEARRYSELLERLASAG